MFEKLEAPLNALCLNKEANCVATAGRNIFKIFSTDGEIREIINLRVGKINLNYSCTDVAWNAVNQSILASSATNGAVVTWDINKTSHSKQLNIYHEHTRTVNRVNFHPSDLNLLLSGSQDGTMKCFDMRSHDFTSTFQSNSESVRDVSFNPSNYALFAAAQENGTVQIWDLRNTNMCVREFSAHNGPAFSCEWHSEEKNILVSAGRDKFIKVWDLTHLPRLQNSIQTFASVSRVKWRPHHKYHMASIALVLDLNINIWDIRQPYIPYFTINSHKDVVTGIQWQDIDSSAQAIISCSKDCQLIHTPLPHPNSSAPSQKALARGFKSRSSVERIAFKAPALVKPSAIATPVAAAFNANGALASAFATAPTLRLNARPHSAPHLVRIAALLGQFIPPSSVSLSVEVVPRSQRSCNAVGSENSERVLCSPTRPMHLDLPSKVEPWRDAPLSPPTTITLKNEVETQALDLANLPAISSMRLYSNIQFEERVDVFKEFAKRYRITASPSHDAINLYQICQHNALLAESLDRLAAAYLWRSLALLYPDEGLLNALIPPQQSANAKKRNAENVDKRPSSNLPHGQSSLRSFKIPKPSSMGKTYYNEDEGEDDKIVNVAKNLVEQNRRLRSTLFAADFAPESFGGGYLENDNSVGEGTEWELPVEGFQLPSGHVTPNSSSSFEDRDSSFDGRGDLSSSSSSDEINDKPLNLGSNEVDQCLDQDLLDTLEAIESKEYFKDYYQTAFSTAGQINTLKGTTVPEDNSFNSEVNLSKEKLRTPDPYMKAPSLIKDPNTDDKVRPMNGVVSYPFPTPELVAPYLIHTLAYYLEKEYDVQTVVCILTVLGPRVMPYIDFNLACNWFASYLDLLRRLKMFVVANTIIKDCSLPQINGLNRQSTVYNNAPCPRCKAKLSNVGASAATGPRSWLCPKCKNRFSLCSVCRLPVKGMYVSCHKCCHGGHFLHMTLWFRDHKKCPSGCGHLCQYR